MENYDELFATLDQLGRDYDQLKDKLATLIGAMQRIADGGPPYSVKVEESPSGVPSDAPEEAPQGLWLSASEMAEIAVLALDNLQENTNNE